MECKFYLNNKLHGVNIVKNFELHLEHDITPSTASAIPNDPHIVLLNQF